MNNRILVTGATGNLGQDIVNSLLNEGYSVKAATRKPKGIKTNERLISVQFDYTDPTTFNESLHGTQGAVLMAPPMDPEAPAKLIPFIENAKTAGLRHLIFISALGADQNEQAPLRIIENAIIGCGLPFTILRPNFFMENFSRGFIAPMIRQGGIFLAAGQGKTSFLSTKDIAAVVAKGFTNALYGKEFNLTGPQALDHNRVAEMISERIGRNITYSPLTEEAMLQGARDSGMPEGAVQYMAVLYSVVRDGWMATITDDVEMVTGQKPTSFQEFVYQNAAAWKDEEPQSGPSDTP